MCLAFDGRSTTRLVCLVWCNRSNHIIQLAAGTLPFTAAIIFCLELHENFCRSLAEMIKKPACHSSHFKVLIEFFFKHGDCVLNGQIPMLALCLAQLNVLELVWVTQSSFNAWRNIKLHLEHHCKLHQAACNNLLISAPPLPAVVLPVKLVVLHFLTRLQLTCFLPYSWSQSVARTSLFHSPGLMYCEETSCASSCHVRSSDTRKTISLKAERWYISALLSGLVTLSAHEETHQDWLSPTHTLLLANWKYCSWLVILKCCQLVNHHYIAKFLTVVSE